MIIDFILNLLEPERFSVANRQVRKTTPDVIEKSSTIAKPIPEKYKKDVEALRKRYGENFKTGLCIEITLKELLEICPRERRRTDAYTGLISFLKGKMGITLNIKSQKTKGGKL
jgi:hypothetical protein